MSTSSTSSSESDGLQNPWIGAVDAAEETRLCRAEALV